METTGFSELSLTDLEDTTGGAAWVGRAVAGARAAGRWALGPVGGAAIGAVSGAVDGYNDPTNRNTGDRIAGAVGGAFHGATFGVFQSTPAY